jgi:hypothetical protein
MNTAKLLTKFEKPDVAIVKKSASRRIMTMVTTPSPPQLQAVAVIHQQGA